MARRAKSVAKIDSPYMKQYDAQVERQKKKKKRLFRRLLLFSIVVVVVVGGLVAYQVKQRTLHAEKQEQFQKLERKMTSLKEDEKDLQEEIRLLQDEDYVLEIARTNYFFSNKGEIIFELPEEEPSY
ncbi:septum formation initiator family protein [Sediminibacillus dalangtanensis]|uniref:Septum formation initiator family protein n=1 Tax=Sediminibacillus dalangtanensis TaxID=2729421 RepID=A0ABX7VYS0_9BACI|nr:septum formation initiator family protein [Sediminibacillus dalangtanensis]QTN01275.1 septum formation initiator family protein [Sediminibacillus dalangtanensis]